VQSHGEAGIRGWPAQCPGMPTVKGNLGSFQTASQKASLGPILWPSEPLHSLRSETKGPGEACPDRTQAIPCKLRAVTVMEMNDYQGAKVSAIEGGRRHAYTNGRYLCTPTFACFRHTWMPSAEATTAQ
jgi:hypothetical protein